jgi:translation initiation factor IF-2
MSSNTVAEFAKERNTTPDTLLQQLKAAGVDKANAADALTEGDKQRLLSHLQASHGSGAKKITLTKKSTSEIKQADSSGRARTIQVEVRKKRTFVKREDTPAEAQANAESMAKAVQERAASQELVRREEDARREAELLSHQEEQLAKERQEREERERREREAEERAAAYAAAEVAKVAEAKAAKEEEKREHAAGAAVLRPRPRHAPRRKPNPRPRLLKKPAAPRIWMSAAARPWPRRKPSAP